MATASAALLEGRLSLGAWQAEMQAAIKLSHVAAAVIAHGGREQMTPARYGSVGRAIRDEYGFLREMAAQIADGRQPFDGTIATRARMYGQAARSTYERARTGDQAGRGYAFCRNVLRAAESCSGCRAETAKGVVPTGSLVPVGSRRPCLRNCKCVIRYFRTAEEAA
jgi:hypothetical protein